MILEYMKMSLFETSKKRMFFTIFIFFFKWTCMHLMQIASALVIWKKIFCKQFPPIINKNEHYLHLV